MASWVNPIDPAVPNGIEALEKLADFSSPHILSSVSATDRDPPAPRRRARVTVRFAEASLADKN